MSAALAAVTLSLTGLSLAAAPAQAAHVGCGDVITQSITLDSDLVGCTGDGLVVMGATNITIDLAGHTISAANGAGDNAGIRIGGSSGVTVINGTVTGFDAGVMIMGGFGNTVRDLTVRDNINDMLGPPCDLGDGIALFDSSGNTIDRNLIVNNGPYGGVSVIGDSDDNVISRNTIEDHTVLGRAGSGCGRADQNEGVRIEGPGADDTIVDRNQVTRSLLAGIGIHGYVCRPGPGEELEEPNTGTVVTRNTVSGSAGSLSDGISILAQGPASVVCPAFATTIERNIVVGNEGMGIYVSYNSFNNTINHNVVNNNGAGGIYLDGAVFNNQFTNVGPTLFDLVQPDRPPYAEGTDYLVMSGSGSGDVTARLVPIDITLAPGATPTNNPQPVDTSTSGCQQSDYDAAGFQAGDIALIQRGTCTFVSKVALAIENDASAVIMFNEGQPPNRTTANFGAVGPVPIPVLSASYPVGFELYQLTQAGPVTAHVVTNTTNVPTLAAPGAYDNVLKMNRGVGNADFDGFDGTLEPPCDNNDWDRNAFATVNQPCVAEGGPGPARVPNRSVENRGEMADGPGRSEDANRGA